MASAPSPAATTPTPPLPHFKDLPDARWAETWWAPAHPSAGICRADPNIEDPPAASREGIVAHLPCHHASHGGGDHPARAPDSRRLVGLTKPTGGALPPSTSHEILLRLVTTGGARQHARAPAPPGPRWADVEGEGEAYGLSK